MVNRRRHGVRVFLFFGLELLLLTGAFFAAYWARQRTSPLWGLELAPLASYLGLWPASVAAWALCLWSFNTYQAFRARTALVHGAILAGLALVVALVLFAGLALLKIHTLNRSFVAVLVLADFIALFLGRLAAAGFLSHYTQKGYDRHYVLIGGPDAEAAALAGELEGIYGAVFQVRGFVGDDPARKGAAVGRWPVLGTFADLPALAAREPVDEVYLIPASGTLESWRELIEQCEAMGVTVHLRLGPFERMISQLHVGEMAGGRYLTFSTLPRSAAQLTAKRLLDFVGAMVLLVLLSPVFMIAALLVKLTSRGPAVFRQERSGMNGRVFTLYKFRTMRLGAEKERDALEAKNEMTGPVFKIRDDPRVTWVGRWFRKTSIDELPQLWNVLKGDMSLVGPRPLPVYEVEKFERWQRRRMTMRPGITCLWQIMGRNRVTDFAEWMKLDLRYVDEWSLGLDFKILLKTIPAVFGGRGAY